MAATSPRRPARGDDLFDAFAAMAGTADDVPVEAAPAQRTRLRRGGPRTPLPLLPLIGVVAGIALAYVGQTAHVTSATYHATSLSSEHTTLLQENQRLGDELDRLRSSERIDAAALQLGMRPPAQWAYVAGTQPAVTVPAAPGRPAPQPANDPLQRLVAALTGSFGTAQAEAASR